MITNSKKKKLKEFIIDVEKVNSASLRCCIMYRVIRSRMKTKNLTFLSTIVAHIKGHATRMQLAFLVLATALGTSGYYSLSEPAGDTSKDSAFCSTKHRHFGTVVRQLYLASETDDSFTVNSKHSPEGTSVFVRYSLRSSILDSCLEVLLDSINCFRYELTYGYSPLRSPPVFS